MERTGSRRVWWSIQLVVAVMTIYVIAGFFYTGPVHERIEHEPLQLKQQTSGPQSVRTQIYPTLPITGGNASADAVRSARNLTRIYDYKLGDEISEFELVRAAAAIQAWIDRPKKGTVYVGKARSFGDGLSVAVIGLEIAIFTNRSLVLSSDFDFSIPKAVTLGSASNLTSVPDDAFFACTDFGAGSDILVSGWLWPSVLYTSPSVGPFLVSTFGAHANFYLGNFLFGPREPKAGCEVRSFAATVETVHIARDFIEPSKVESALWRCGVESVKSAIFAPVHVSGYAQSMACAKDSDWACAMRVAVASGKVISTLGSASGYWARALHGRGGGFLDTYELLCVNVSHSQAASIFHLALPHERKQPDIQADIMGVNWRMMPCRDTTEDLEFYIEYLMW